MDGRVIQEVMVSDVSGRTHSLSVPLQAQQCEPLIGYGHPMLIQADMPDDLYVYLLPEQQKFIRYFVNHVVEESLSIGACCECGGRLVKQSNGKYFCFGEEDFDINKIFQVGA